MKKIIPKIDKKTMKGVGVVGTVLGAIASVAIALIDFNNTEGGETVKESKNDSQENS